MIYGKRFPLWNPGGRIPLDPVTGLCWKYNKKVAKPIYMHRLEADSHKKMRK